MLMLGEAGLRRQPDVAGGRIVRLGKRVEIGGQKEKAVGCVNPAG
jgi:hypothetical protein